ncbi:transcription elongation factor GreAB [bacterium]|nr:MAG: transcription elongation factor GreAB [bacterium]
MSRAFVKESEDAPELPAARPESGHPNYVTQRGLEALEERLRAAEASSNERDTAYLRRRIENAIVVDLTRQPRDVVAFGATVTVQGADAARRDYTIVGEDQADPTHGAISWISPLAKALIGARVGDRVLWRRPAGDLPLTIVAIGYAA